MSVALDTDAILWSAPESQRAERPLLVLLHGYGSHEGDLFGLSPHLPLAPVIASLRAPLSESGGYAWFSRLSNVPGDPRPEEVTEAAQAILDWLDSIEYTSVSLLGFSQGGAMALQLLRLAPERFGAIVTLAGFVASGTLAGDAALQANRPPVFWGRGTIDRVITADAVARTDAWLPSHATADIRIYEGLAHSISREELADLVAFLNANP
ncbi:dienelactone hydrolase family protein [soil metagenome]